MRKVLWVLLILVVGAVLATGAAVLFAFDDAPLVRNEATFTPASIERAKRILDRNDPRRLRTGDVRTVSLSAQDADLALNQSLQRLAHGSGRLVLQQGIAHVALSIEVPRSPVGTFLNVDATLDEAGGLPHVSYLRIGALRVPAALANRLVAAGLSMAEPDGDLRLVVDMIQQVRFGKDRLTVVYRWQDRAPERLKAATVPPEDQARLLAYRTRLADWSRRVPGASVSMVALLDDLFRFASDRSATGDPIEENRAAILTAALYVVQQDIAALVPEAKTWPQAAPRPITLSGRDDFPKHFLVSAALAANAGKSLADAVGLYKEIQDARGGSGFSFNDIAADGAGTRFGELATGSADAARKLQQRVATGLSEADVMPASADLPEFMPEAEFVQRFGGVGGPEYSRMMTEIDARIDALPINR
jgi:hypothetical protein